ncbi:MAG: molybdate ABC transporter substrate-binding protein [Litoreibacter sp.]|nr:molybdate ABC transporter substrate-binding protein [Litoreibacter sp.]
MFLGAGAACLLTSRAAAQAPVTVFAAASLKTALDEVMAGYDGAVRASYGGSGALARQIILGAPAGIFLSAHPDWMDQAAQAGALKSETRHDLLGNRLVLIAPAGSEPQDLMMPLPADARVAMGLLDAVPAGQYGRAAFRTLGHWNQVAERVVQTDNVRAALALVARGEVEFGVVYETDALAEPKVEIAAGFPPESHPPIRYPLALTKAADANAEAFYSHLQSAEAKAIFARHGFDVF